MKLFAKRISKLANDLDMRGLTKSADKFDKIITRLAQHDDDYDDLAEEWDRMELEDGDLEKLENTYDLEDSMKMSEEDMKNIDAETLLMMMKDFLASGKADNVSKDSRLELEDAVRVLEIELEGPQQAWGGFAMGEKPGDLVELPTAEASHTAKLFSIANKLDQKGLTKEADVMDQIAIDILNNK